MRQLYTAIICSMLLCHISPSLLAQNLEAGDIAFVSYRADAPDAFAFVALADIPPNEIIFFTDKGWESGNDFTNQEGIIEYTAPALGLPCGTVVTISLPPSPPNSAVATIGDADVVDNGFDLLAGAGDQILAFQGSTAIPTFLAAINNSGTAGEWQIAVNNNANTSTLPTGLVDGQTAISLVETNNYNYDDSVITGLKSELLSAINNEANWDGEDANTHPPYTTLLLLPTDCNADDATITHTGLAPTGEFISPGTNNTVIYQVQVTVTDENVVLTELEFDAMGDWIPADIANFKLRYSIDDMLDVLDATLDEIEMGFSGGNETITFSGFQQAIPIGTSYLFITMDVSNDAIFCREITAQVDADSDLTYSQTPTFVNSSFALGNSFTLGSGVVVDVQFVKASSAVAEGNPGSNLMYFIDVIVEDRPCGDLTVNVSSVAGTADASDFSAVNETLVFPTASEYPLTLQVPFVITGDATIEDDETFDLVLTIVDGFGQPGAITTHTVTIIDNDSAPLNYYSNCQGANPCNWTDLVWNTQADGMGTNIPDPNDPNANVIIQSGDVVVLNVNERRVRNLTVEAGATLTGTGNPTNAKFLSIFGSSVLVDGITSGALSLNIASSAATISGAGDISFRRIRHTGLSDADLTIDANVDLTFNGGAALYNFISNYSFDVTINSGDTVTVTNGNVSIDGADGINGGERGGLFTIDGVLDIQQGILYLYTDNDILGVQYLVNGYLHVGGSIAGSALETGISRIAQLTVASGATVEVSGAGDPFDNISPAFNVVDFQTGSLIIYSSDMSQNVANEFEYASFTASGGGNKNLVGDVNINGTLNPVSGNIVLGSHDLIMGPAANALEGSSASYVRTNGQGVMTYELLGATAKLYPVGNSSYNPISINNNGVLDDYSIRVLDRVPENGNSGSSLTTRIVNRTWLLFEDTAGGGDLDVEVQWNESEEAADFVRELSYIGRYFDGEWQADLPKPAMGTDPYTQTRAGVAAAIAFAVGSSGALPVEYLYFEAKAISTGHLLEWATASETANDYFAIERSADGLDFVEIGRVAGQGNRDVETAYSFLDRSPLAGQNYYRLLQVDFDGSSDYSVVRLLENIREVQPALFPNPVQDVLHIQMAISEEGIYQVRNGLGQIVLRGNWLPDAPTPSIDVNRLVPGTYWLQVETNGRTEQLSFQKM